MRVLRCVERVLLEVVYVVRVLFECRIHAEAAGVPCMGVCVLVRVCVRVCVFVCVWCGCGVRVCGECVCSASVACMCVRWCVVWVVFACVLCVC